MTNALALVFALRSAIIGSHIQVSANDDVLVLGLDRMCVANDRDLAAHRVNGHALAFIHARLHVLLRD
jgi:hypothetical protein